MKIKRDTLFKRATFLFDATVTEVIYLFEIKKPEQERTHKSQRLTWNIRLGLRTGRGEAPAHFSVLLPLVTWGKRSKNEWI